MGFNTPPTIDESQDIDHQETTNRTHDGDDITPASVDTDNATHTDSYTDPSGVSYPGIVGALASAGFTAGTVVPLIIATPPKNRIQTVSSSTFVNAYDAGQMRVFPADTFPNPDKVRFAQTVQIGGGSGAGTNRVRWINQTANEPVGIEVSTTNPPVKTWSGWTDYNFPNPDTTTGFNVQAKNDNGNDTQIDNTNLYIGIQL